MEDSYMIGTTILQEVFSGYDSEMPLNMFTGEFLLFSKSSKRSMEGELDRFQSCPCFGHEVFALNFERPSKLKCLIALHSLFV